MDLSKFIYHKENAFSDEFCDQLVNLFQDKEKEEVVFELTDEVIDDYNTNDIEKSFYPEDKNSKQF